MTYQLTKRLQHRVEITGRLEAAEVERQQQGILRSLGRSAQLPGFRPGKAPMALLKARFADEVKQELHDKCIETLWHEIVEKEEEFHPISQLNVSSAQIEEDGSFALTAEIEVRPVIALGDPTSISLPEYSVEVSEDEIQSELEKLQKEQADWEPADEEPAADGMRVECVFHGEYVDEGEVFVHEENAGFVIGHEDLYPEINEAMQGAMTGDTRSATKQFDDDDPDESRAGKKARFDITVKSLKREALPEVDDELAKNIGLESLDELQQRINSVLAQNKRAERHGAWRRACLDQICTDFDLNELPPGLVSAMVNDELVQLEQFLVERGADKSTFDRQEMAAKIEPQARKKVLDLLIIEQLASEWEITGQELAQQLVMAQAAQLNVPAAEHKANLVKEKKLEGIVNSARLSATVDELIKRAGGEVT